MKGMVVVCMFILVSNSWAQDGLNKVSVAKFNSGLISHVIKTLGK